MGNRKRDETGNMYKVLAQAYDSLAALYDSQGESTLAAEFRNRAEEARAAAPRPW